MPRKRRAKRRVLKTTKLQEVEAIMAKASLYSEELAEEIKNKIYSPLLLAKKRRDVYSQIKNH